MSDLIWLIPALPLAGFALLVFAGRRIGEPGAGWIATAAVGGSFLATVGVFISLLGQGAEERAFHQTLFEWLPVGGLTVNMGFLADPLSVTMCLFVTGIATLIHMYAIGYMHGDERFTKFFVYLNLFVFSMLMLVLGDNMLVTFLGWEGVGACSYFLISFWHESEANASAGKKAFVTNRIGDFGFIVAMMFTFAAIGTLDYAGIVSAAPSLATTTATAIAVALFVGACGKSAQLPLFVWLPDAMAGPTPVSALIHAATMVTAGVYVMTRMNPLVVEAASWVPTLIAGVGAATALFAATVALAQRDIKKVLAYSTVSQLGYMFLAVGSGAYVAAIFHMVTHAFFKALLFLGSGSVIHGMHGEQDMRRMGALRKAMPVTAVTFIIGWLAIAGVPPFAGFWSKDEILLFAWEKSPILWAVGFVTAVLTAFYMSRQVFMVFFGEARWDRPLAEAVPELAAEREAEGIHEGHGAGPTGAIHPHESPWLMTLPLVVLAVLSIFGGVLNLPVLDSTKFLEHWLEPVIHFGEAHPDASTIEKVALAGVATTSLLGLLGAVIVYIKGKGALAPKIELKAMLQGWYYDSSISNFMGGPGRKAFQATADFDKAVIDGAVNGVGTLVAEGSSRARLIQTGYVRTYALGLTLGTLLVVALLFSKAVF
ncbi:MAG: NADH-quinone oxidoreductase subunit L [Microthrixaceae bacterium]|nr:NADH-quinone oxidoreductase subunit L [Acidimicrobiales bacterium]MCB9404426.1 NADH-quinone oxidoreductase subunit L [Microthrixaceae bacterium]